MPRGVRLASRNIRDSIRWARRRWLYRDSASSASCRYVDAARIQDLTRSETATAGHEEHEGERRTRRVHIVARQASESPTSIFCFLTNKEGSELECCGPLCMRSILFVSFVLLRVLRGRCGSFGVTCPTERQPVSRLWKDRHPRHSELRFYPSCRVS